MNRLKTVLTAFLALVANSVCAANIAVLAPAASELTDQFTTALQQLRPDDSIALHVLGTSPAPAPDLLVALGWRALQWQQQQFPTTPAVAAYMEIGKLQGYTPASTAALHILLVNPKPSRQIALACLLLPRLDTLGLLYSNASRMQLPAWQDAADSAGLKLFTRDVEGEKTLMRPLTDVLSRSDVLMALEDQTIYRTDNLRALLLTSYARDKVLIGPSAPFIPAGSLSTTFSSPVDTARSVSEMLAREIVPGISYPRYFSVKSNPHVARSLGYPPPDDATLHRALLEREASQ